jgi:hypothetical protein
MPNLETVTDQISAGDAGRWRAAVGRAGELVWGLGWSQPGEDPAREIPLVTAALMV